MVKKGDSKDFGYLYSAGMVRDSVNLITSNFLLNELEKAIGKKDKAKSKAVYARMKHLYDYLNPNEKAIIQNRFKKVTNSFNKLK